MIFDSMIFLVFVVSIKPPTHKKLIRMTGPRNSMKLGLEEGLFAETGPRGRGGRSCQEIRLTYYLRSLN